MTKVLAVDDTKLLRDMLAGCLRDAGHDVVLAKDGAEALEMLREHRPEIVITDLNMPVMDGLDFIENARSEPVGRDLPILLLTTETGQHLKDRAKTVGATGWLTKPFDSKQIIQLVEQLT